jgi:hypothetical protein
MKRFLQLISVLFASTLIGGCVSASQKIEEQQQLERSIQKTSDPDAVKGCVFIMTLRPDGLHSTPEAQAASLVLPQPGVSWVVFGSSGNYELYSCSRKTPRNEQEAKAPAPTPTPVETKPTAGTSAPAETKAAPARSEAKPEVVQREQPEAKIKAPEPAKKSASRTRVTSNPEAVKGCKFLESFVEYRKVARFQEDVVRAGGNVGFIVAANQDGDVIGESYLCSEEAKP